MAFQSAQSAVDNNVSPFDRNNSRDDSWKSDAFINFYLPTKGGKARKLGTIALKKSKPAEAELIAYLQEDPTRIAQVLAKCEVDFRLSEASEDSMFDLV